MTGAEASSKPGLRSTWRVLRSLARFELGTFGLHVLGVTLGVYLLPFLPGLIVKGVLDSLTTAHVTPWVRIVELLGAGLLAAATTALVWPVSVKLRVTAQTLLRRNMLASLLDRPGAAALESTPGEALVRFNDDTQSVAMALDFFADPIGQVLAFSFGITVLAQVSPFLTAAVVAPTILSLLAIGFESSRIQEARRRRQETHGEVSSLLGEALAAVGSIQAATAEDRVVARLRELGVERRKSALRDLVIDRVLTSLTNNMSNVAIGELLLLLALSPARLHSFTPGDFALFVSYLGQFAQVGSLLATMLLLGRQTGVSVDRMVALTDGGVPALVAGHSLQPSPSAAARPLVKGVGRGLPAVGGALPVGGGLPAFEGLEATGLTYRHPSSGRGIAGVDLAVQPGELVVVTGKIGAGKTTLVRSLLGLLPIQAGSVTWNGAAVEDLRRFLVPPRVAYTAQVPRLFSLELGENVRLGMEVTDDHLDRSAHRAAFERDIEEMEHGWATQIGSRGVKLSGGQIQRAATARMLARPAQLLVLDDLSSALDAETEALLWSRLLTEGSTCLAVSHRRVALRNADRIVVLDHGTVVAEGTLAELLASLPLMRELWGGTDGLAAPDELAVQAGLEEADASGGPSNPPRSAGGSSVV